MSNEEPSILAVWSDAKTHLRATFSQGRFSLGRQTAHDVVSPLCWVDGSRIEGRRNHSDYLRPHLSPALLLFIARSKGGPRGERPSGSLPQQRKRLAKRSLIPDWRLRLRRGRQSCATARAYRQLWKKIGNYKANPKNTRRKTFPHGYSCLAVVSQIGVIVRHTCAKEASAVTGPFEALWISCPRSPSRKPFEPCLRDISPDASLPPS